MIRNISIMIIFTLLTAITSGARAAGNLFVSKTIAIEAPPAQVWEKVRDFNALEAWHPAVAKTEILEGENNTPGAVRRLTLKDGGTINEELSSWDESTMTYSYTIFESVLPVSDYEATLQVQSVTETSARVTWSASFSAGKNADDRTARDTISGIFDSGLENLAVIMTAP